MYLDLNGFEGWMDKKLILIRLKASCFHNHIALTKLIDRSGCAPV